MMALSILCHVLSVFLLSVGTFVILAKEQRKNIRWINEQWRCEYAMHQQGRLGAFLRNIDEIAKEKGKNSQAKPKDIEIAKGRFIDLAISNFSIEFPNCDRLTDKDIFIDIFKRGDRDDLNHLPKFSYRFAKKE